MKKLWRVAAALCIGHVVLVLAGFSLQKVPRLGDGDAAVGTAFGTGAAGRAYAGEYVAMTGFLVFLLLVPLLGRLLRGTGEASRWFGAALTSIGATYVAVTLAAESAVTTASLYDARHGTDLGVVAAINNVHNVADYIGTATLGAFILTVAAAAFAGGALPRWLAWLSLPVGLLSLAGGAFPTGIMDIATLVWMAWFAVLAV
ncbi:MAG TPA: hypothetical protein VKB69_12850, partial [Micromonosporaceae bacterium]|nr:hypothetical protein [Micromonosporaceae bacterium]